jgi:uridine kinase
MLRVRFCAQVNPTPIVIFEGLHPMHDERVNQALDLTIYLDITDDVKFAWKAQRDIAERGATMEQVQKAIDGRKPDFSAFVEPQKAKADIIIQVHSTTPHAPAGCPDRACPRRVARDVPVSPCSLSRPRYRFCSQT